MKQAKDIKFKIINKNTNETCIVSLSDLQGYEGEDCGVFVCNYENGQLPEWVIGKKVSVHSGYSDTAPDDTIGFGFVEQKDTAKEIFGELIKSTALCEPQGGYCSLDYLIVKARQHGLEYVGLDKDGNVIWVGDTTKLD